MNLLYKCSSFIQINQGYVSFLTDPIIEPYKCQHCDSSFSKYLTLKAHTTEIHGKIFKCENCEASFKKKTDLKAHVEKEHTENTESFKCNDCNFTFSELPILKVHEAETHGKFKIFKCKDCDASFYKPNYLKIHARKHEKVKHSKGYILLLQFFESKNLPLIVNVVNHSEIGVIGNLQ